MLKIKRKVPKFIIKLDTDDAQKIKRFKELWNELNTEIVFIPKSAKINIKGSKTNNEN